MPFDLGPIEFLLVLAVWALPIAILVWFIRAIASIRDSLQRIADQLERLGRGGNL